MIAPEVSSEKQRVEWVDVARGIAITLVVLHHGVQRADWDALTNPTWVYVTEMLRTLRMPLFFLVAGMFASGWIVRPWPVLLRGKVLLLAWVYALWAVIWWAWFTLPPGGDPVLGEGLRTLASRTVLPYGAWFLYALAIFFVLAKLCASIDRRIQIGVALAGSAVWLGEVVVFGNHVWDGVPKFFVFFLIGCYGRHLILDWAPRIGLAVRVAIIPAWAGLYVALDAAELADKPGTSLVLRFVALAAGISLATLLAGCRPMQHLGKRTLPIYVSHELLVAVAVVAVSRLWNPVGDPWVAFMLPVAAAAFGMGAALLLEMTARRLGAGWLFETPRPLYQMLAGRAGRATRRCLPRRSPPRTTGCRR